MSVSFDDPFESLYFCRQPPYYSSYEILATAKELDERTGLSRTSTSISDSSVDREIADSDGSHFQPEVLAALSTEKPITDSDGNYFNPAILGATLSQ